MTEVQRIFTDIYERKQWGDSSGGGSGPEARRPWAACVSGFIAAMQPRLVISLGCGDGWGDAEIELGSSDYIGVDVVRSVVDDARHTHGSIQRSFRQVTGKSGAIASNDALVICKEVTQHLSYADIAKLLDGLECPILHCSAGADRLNICDIETGAFRGVSLALPPFRINAKSLFRWSFGETNYHVEVVRP